MVCQNNAQAKKFSNFSVSTYELPRNRDECGEFYRKPRLLCRIVFHLRSFLRGTITY